MKTRKTKLALDRETLVSLDPRALVGAVGGVGGAVTYPTRYVDCATELRCPPTGEIQ